MPHAFRVGQLVALAQTSRDPETYEVVQLMPETPSGEPQYRIKGLSSGIVRAVREAEINPHLDGGCAAPRPVECLVDRLLGECKRGVCLDCSAPGL
jgi:hypothetical protein